LIALALWAVSLHLVRREWFALLGLAPIALHLLWQGAALGAGAGRGGASEVGRWRRRACEVPLEPHGRLPDVPRLPGRRQFMSLHLNAEPLPRPHARRP